MIDDFDVSESGTSTFSVSAMHRIGSGKLDEITRELLKRWGLNFTKQNASSLWFLCKQEPSLLTRTDQACALFSSSEFDLLEWTKDLEVFILKGCGNSLNFWIRVPLLEDYVQSMEQAIKANEDGLITGSYKVVRLIFAHAEMVFMGRIVAPHSKHNTNNIQSIVRVQECVMDGFKRFAHGHLIAFYKATNYYGAANNVGAILVLGKYLVVISKLIYPLPPAISSREYSSEHQIEDTWVMIGVYDGEDLHFRKAEFDPVECPPYCSKPCENICPTDAISGSSKAGLSKEVLSERCYGCGRCLPVCPYDKISGITHVRDVAATAELLKHDEVDAIEIQTSGRHA